MTSWKQVSTVMNAELLLLRRQPLSWAVLGAYLWLPLLVMPSRNAPYAFLTPGSLGYFRYSSQFCGEVTGFSAALLAFTLLSLLVQERSRLDSVVKADTILAGLPSRRTSYLAGKLAAIALLALVALALSAAGGVLVQTLRREASVDIPAFVLAFAGSALPATVFVLAVVPLAYQATPLRQHLFFLFGATLLVDFFAASAVYPDVPVLVQPAYYLDPLGMSSLMVNTFRQSGRACFVVLKVAHGSRLFQWACLSPDLEVPRLLLLGGGLLLVIASWVLALQKRGIPCAD